MSEIRVDEDWKERVQREKAEAAQKAKAQPQTSPSASPEKPSAQPVSAPAEPSDAVEAGTPPPEGEVPAPEGEAHPLFEALIGSLATQVMYSLGFMGAPGQQQGQVVVNLDQAKEVMDMLVMLQEKTNGNLTTQENSVMAETLTELQRLFAARVQQAQAQAMQQAGMDPNRLRGEPPQ